jgi:hypothetical protein
MKSYVCQVTKLTDEQDVINLIGPFSSNEDAADYGASHCSPGGPDDPRWNSVRDLLSCSRWMCQRSTSSPFSTDAMSTKFWSI